MTDHEEVVDLRQRQERRIEEGDDEETGSAETRARRPGANSTNFDRTQTRNDADSRL